MKNLIIASVLALVSTVAYAQDNDFKTCYANVCELGELTVSQLASTDQIEVRSIETNETYDIISFTIEFIQGDKKYECTGRGNMLDARCKVFREKLLVGDHMIVEDVVFKDIKGGGKIRTAPELNIEVVKPPYLED